MTFLRYAPKKRHREKDETSWSSSTIDDDGLWFGGATYSNTLDSGGEFAK
jgi:hypothetical protein